MATMTLADALVSDPVTSMLAGMIDKSVQRELDRVRESADGGRLKRPAAVGSGGRAPSLAVLESAGGAVGDSPGAGAAVTLWQSLCGGRAGMGPQNGLGVAEASASGVSPLPVKPSSGDTDEAIKARILARVGGRREDLADRRTRATRVLEALQSAPDEDAPMVDHVSGRVLEADMRYVADVPAGDRGWREVMLMRGCSAETVATLCGGDAA